MMKKGLLLIACLTLFAMKSQAEVPPPGGVVAVGVRVNVVSASPCGGGCSVPMPPPPPVPYYPPTPVPYSYGYGTHGAYGGAGYGYGPGYSYGYGYGCPGGYCGGQRYYASSCGRCHKAYYYQSGYRYCGCKRRGSFALAINTGSFAFGLSIW